MLKLIGFWLGVALTALGLLYLVDPPQAARLADGAADRISGVLADLGRSVKPAPAPAPPNTDASPSASAQGDAPEPSELSAGTADAPLRGASADDPAPQPLPQPTPAGPQTPAPLAPPAPPARTWYAFWDPFHSEVSAHGFANRLALLTGLELRVTDDGPGRYRVAFAYAGEPDRRAAIAAIEARAGLRIDRESP